MFRKTIVFFFCSIFAFSAWGEAKRRAVRVTTPSTYKTLVPVVPEANGNYKIDFIAWFPVPVGVTMIGYGVTETGRTAIPGLSATVLPDEAGRGWSSQILRGPVPPGVTAYEVEFSGTLNFTVSGPLPSIDGRTPPPFEVTFKDGGQLCVEGNFDTEPVIALNGHGFPAVDGCVIPTPDYTGLGVAVTAGSGYPDIVSYTRIIDIPTPAPSFVSEEVK